MWIYKITNIQNNKVYIGQTIRKYGKDSFVVKQIDTAKTQDELNKKRTILDQILQFS